MPQTLTPPAPAETDYEEPDDLDDADEFAAIGHIGDKASEPSAKGLVDAVQEAMANLGDYHSRLQANHETRFAIWSGQSNDGRKWAKHYGRPVFPWDGASDYRARVAEEYLLENVARMKAAYFRGNFQAAAHGIDRMGLSQNATRLLTYVLRTQMMPDVRDQIDFAANWQQTYGLSILHVGWQQETRMEPQEITLEQMAEMALQMAAASPQGQALQQAGDAQGLGALAMGSVEETLTMIADPANEKTLAREIVAMAPWLTTRQAREVVKELRETGRSTYPNPRTAVNRPRWTALRPQVDVFFPREVKRLQDAPWIAMIVDLTRDQLRDKERTEGWNRDFIDAVEENEKGNVIDEQAAAVGTSLLGGAAFLRQGVESSSGRSYAATVEDQSQIYQVLRVFYRASDKKGFPGIFEAVVHPNQTKHLGLHRLVPCSHGQYPFVAFRRERVVPCLIESRGVPEICETDQEAIKVNRDFMVNRTELGSLPPLKVSANRGGGNYPLHPGCQIPERQNSKTEFLDMPRLDGQQINLEERVKLDLDRYFGRASEAIDPATTQMKQQEVVDDFLADLGEAVRLTWADLQQYMSPVTLTRVLGNSANVAQPVQVTRDEIQGQYDFSLTFDVRDLDTEYMIKKVGTFNDFVLAADTLGIVDRSVYPMLMAQAIDPQMAAMLMRDPQEAQQDEIEDEKRAVAQISAGTEPAMMEGQNHEARAQVLEQAVMANPNLMQRYQQDEIFKAMIDARLQHHRFQVEQRQNALIGRQGAASVLGV